MSKNKTLEALKRSLQDDLQSIQDREKKELNEEQKKGLKDVIEKIFEQALLDKDKPKDILDTVLEDKAEFLKIFNPWQNQKLIQKFVNTINNPDSNKDFSWLEILDGDKQWQKEDNQKTKNEINDKTKHVNMRYQIPTHFHGDIDNAVLFYCMENPRGYIEDSDMDTWAEKQMFGKQTIEDYYKYTAELRDETWKNETSQKIIKERYKLNDVTTDLTDLIEKIIYSDAEHSPLTRELKNMFDEEKEFFEEKYILKPHSNSKKPDLSEKYYYIARYYAQLLDINGENLSKYNESEYKEEAKAEQTKALKISEKICNLEIYPFSSSEPKLDGKGIGNTLLLNSDLSRLGVYILLRRIYRYLDNKAEKPVIIFRKYDSAWEKLFKEIFKKTFSEVESSTSEFNTYDLLEKLEENFFFCQLSSQGGGITSGNVISVPDFKAWKNIYEILKETAFTEIYDLITKSDNEQELKD